jgi:thiamine monophosphate synthase
MGELRIIGKKADLMYYEEVEGEERITWSRSSPEEVSRAEEVFKKYLMKGWIAYTATSDNRKIQVFSFNPELDEIVLVPIISGG